MRNHKSRKGSRIEAYMIQRTDPTEIPPEEPPGLLANLQAALVAHEKV